MHPCPRMKEVPASMRLVNESVWRPDNTCSYCGSMNPDALFECIEAGSEITPTDKNYKIYVDRPNPKAGQMSVRQSANFEQTGEGWVQVTAENIDTLPLDDYQRKHYLGHWVKPDVESAREQGKFYFQHLNAAEQERFMALYNARKVKMAMPGHFYVLPFFCVAVKPPETSGAAV